MKTPSSSFTISPVTVCWPDRKGRLVKRRAYQARDSMTGERLGYPQATVKLVKASLAG